MDMMQIGANTDLWLVLLAFIAIITISLGNWLSPAKTFLCVSLLLFYFGVIDSSALLSGFANTGLFTIAALYVVVAGLRESGATILLRRYFIGQPESPQQVMNRLLPVTSILSAVVNNTPIVAMFTSLSQSMSKRFNVPVSKLLLPLSYASILGGLCTLIGTSTNVLVHDLMQQQLNLSFGLFELAYVGIPLTLIGLLYLKFIAPWLLPNRLSTRQQFEQTREYLVEMKVETNSELIEQTVQQAGLRNLPGLFLIEILRRDHSISAISSETYIQAGDRLIFAGNPESVSELQNIYGLTLANNQRFKLDSSQQERRLFEVVLSQSNSIVGRTLKEVRFRHKYNAVALSISRQGERLKGKLGEITLQAGDTLLLEAQKGFLFRYRYSRDFLLVSKINNGLSIDTSRAGLALGLFALMILSAGFGILSIFKAATLTALAMIVSRCIQFDDAGRSIDFQVLIVIACALALGQAVQSSGLGIYVAELMLSHASTPVLALCAIYISTQLLTEMITNNAAAIVMFPIAVTTADNLFVSTEPFMIAVMIAASASFITPTGYQTNLMVMSPGGYRYSDYVKLGFPLSLMVAVISLLLIPIFWSF